MLPQCFINVITATLWEHFCTGIFLFCSSLLLIPIAVLLSKFFLRKPPTLFTCNPNLFFFIGLVTYPSLTQKNPYTCTNPSPLHKTPPLHLGSYKVKWALHVIGSCQYSPFAFPLPSMRALFSHRTGCGHRKQRYERMLLGTKNDLHAVRMPFDCCCRATVHPIGGALVPHLCIVKCGHWIVCTRNVGSKDCRNRRARFWGRVCFSHTVCISRG